MSGTTLCEFDEIEIEVDGRRALLDGCVTVEWETVHDYDGPAGIEAWPSGPFRIASMVDAETELAVACAFDIPEFQPGDQPKRAARRVRLAVWERLAAVLEKRIAQIGEDEAFNDALPPDDDDWRDRRSDD